MIRPVDIKVLVVHQKKSSLEAILRRLEIFGFVTTGANSISEGTTLLQKNPGTFDILIANLESKEMGSGISWIQDIKSIGTKPLQVFVLTEDYDGTAKQLYNAGAESVFKPPLDTKSLINLTRKSLISIEARWNLPPNIQAQSEIKLEFDSFRSAQKAKQIKLGRGGFCLKTTSEEAAKNRILEIDILAPPLHLRGVAKVLWAEPNGIGYKLGVEFLHLKNPNAKLISEWIEKNKPTAYVPSNLDD